MKALTNFAAKNRTCFSCMVADGYDVIPTFAFIFFYVVSCSRKLFLKHGEKAQFKHLENIDVDLYDEMEILSDFLYSDAGTEEERKDRSDRIAGVYAEYQHSKRTPSDARIMQKAIDKICPYDLTDYKVVFPAELKRDVLDDNYLDWVAIENEQNADNYHKGTVFGAVLFVFVFDFCLSADCYVIVVTHVICDVSFAILQIAAIRSVPDG